MPERPLHVVVATTRADAGSRALAGAVAEVFEDGPRERAPIALPVSEPAGPARPELEGADVLVALDAVALEDARAANVGLRVALWPGLGDAWLGSVEGADLVLVAHGSQVDVAVQRGAPRGIVEVVGPLRPTGFRPAADRRARAAQLGLSGEHEGLPEGARVLLVPAAALPGTDLSTTFAQLALVKGPLFVLFDVEDDVEAAKSIRALAPRFGLAAAMFSEREIARDAYALADRALVRLEGPETFAALSSGVPLFVVRPKTREVEAARALTEAGLAAVASAPSMIAVELDAALAPEALEAARAAIVALDVDGTPRRVAAAVEAARKRLRPRATGLPRGLELLPRDPADAAIEATAPLVQSAVSRRKAEDDAVERELAELKKRLGG